MNTILPSPVSSPEEYTLDTILMLLKNVQTLALSIAGGIAVIFLLIGAFWYFTAFGNEEKANKGKTTIMWAIIGIIVIILSAVIVDTIKNILM